MKRYVMTAAVAMAATFGLQAQTETEMQYPPENAEGYELVWSDEFNYKGAPDPSKWNFERGFVRNKELQWYQPKNAVVADGVLKITARKEKVKNPNYRKKSREWHENRKNAECTSSSITTKGKYDFTYGHMEVRAKVPTQKGAWSAIWTLGTEMPWASCGEIDVMECYRENGIPSLVANVIHGNDQPWQGVTDGIMKPISEFQKEDKDWTRKFHVWTLDWDENTIRIGVDGKEIKSWDMSKIRNGSIGEGINPFTRPQYLLLNLAVSGSKEEKPKWDKKKPMVYEVDYVRVFQKKR